MAERTQVGLGLAQHQPQPQLASCFPALEGFLQWSRQRKYLSYQISGLKKESIPHCLGALVPCQAGPVSQPYPPAWDHSWGTSQDSTPGYSLPLQMSAEHLQHLGVQG